MNIALIAPFLSSSMGGMSSYIAELVPRLCDAGQQVSVISSDCGYQGAPCGQLVTIDKRAELQVFPVRGAVDRRFYRSPDMWRWLEHAVDRFDIVDIQGVWTWMTRTAARACINKRVPYVITPHGTMSEWDWSKRRLSKLIFFTALLREAWQSAAAIRYLSRGEFESSVIQPRANATIIPNAVSLASAGHSGTREAALQVKTRLGIPSEAPIVLFLGRVTDQKGVIETLHAFEVVHATCPDAFLVLAGPLEGEYGQSVRHLAAKLLSRHCIRLVGPIYGDEKIALMTSATVFVTLSKHEGLPLAVLEALSYGTPSVVTPESNIPELGDCDAGIVSEIQPANVAIAILRIITDNERRDRMANNAVRFVQRQFSWQRVLPQLIRFYEAAAASAA